MKKMQKKVESVNPDLIKFSLGFLFWSRLIKRIIKRVTSYDTKYFFHARN